MKVLSQIERALVTRLLTLKQTPTNPAGPVKAVRVFRGSPETAELFFDDPLPALMLQRLKWNREGEYGIAMHWRIHFRNDNRRSEEDAFSGSGIAGESVGLDATGEQIFNLLNDTALPLADYGGEIVSITGGGAIMDEHSRAYGECLEVSVRLPRFEE